MVIQGIDEITLMDGEDVLHQWHPHWAYRSNSPLHLFKPPLCVVTTERVIVHTPTWTGGVTDEYPIRDVHQLQTEGTNSVIDRFDIGSISFSVGGGGDKIVLDGVKKYEAISNAIRERQRELA